MAVSLKDNDRVGSAAAVFRESTRREAMIGTMIAFALVDMGWRQSPRGRTNAKERKLTLRARPVLFAEIQSR